MKIEMYCKKIEVLPKESLKLFCLLFAQCQLFVYLFILQEDVNVICVDWSAGAADPNYVRAAVNTRLVGKQVALLVESINQVSYLFTFYQCQLFVYFLFQSIGKSINTKTHMVGFSLGAHVAGFAGNHLKNLSRITGEFFSIYRANCSIWIVFTNSKHRT